eukprot:scaffold15108_cov180-Amphora_coffeaeformis.AAC.1
MSTLDPADHESGSHDVRMRRRSSSDSIMNDDSTADVGSPVTHLLSSSSSESVMSPRDVHEEEEDGRSSVEEEDGDDEVVSAVAPKSHKQGEPSSPSAKPDPPATRVLVAAADEEPLLRVVESSVTTTTPSVPADTEAAAVSVANREARLQQRIRRLRNLVLFCGCLLLCLLIVAVVVTVLLVDEAPFPPSPTSYPGEQIPPVFPTPPPSYPPTTTTTTTTTTTNDDDDNDSLFCVCAPCPCVTPYRRRGNTDDLEGYGGTDIPTVALSADGNILVTRRGGTTGNNDGDVVQAYFYRADTRTWVTRGAPLVGPGTASLSYGAPIFSLASTDGNFLVMGSTTIQFWTYDAAIDAWWGPSAGDAVGQPSTTGNPSPDSSYSDGYSVTLSDDGNRLVLAGDAMQIQPNVAHVFDRQNVANWVRAGSPLYNEQPTDVSFTATLSGDGTTVALGAPDHTAGGFNLSGHVRVFRWKRDGRRLATTGTNIGRSRSLSSVWQPSAPVIQWECLGGTNSDGRTPVSF